MNNSRVRNKSILTLLIIFFSIYTYFSMYGLIFDIGTSWINMMQMATCVLATFSILMEGYIPIREPMNRMWFVWCIFFIIVFFLFGLRGEGIADIFAVLFAPASYFVTYCATTKLKTTQTIAYLSIIIMIITINMIRMSALFNAVDITNDEHIEANNLYFFLLCLVPFIFLIRNNLLKNILFLVAIAMGIITLKRSAIIALTLITILYLYQTFFFRNINKKRGVFMAICLLLCGGYVIHKNLTNTTELIQERIAGISEDQGSGRIPLYEDVLNKMKSTNDLPAWIIGNGKGSIYSTGHTNAHNDALQMLYEYGVIGLCLYIWLIIIIIKKSFKLFKHKHYLFMPYAASVIITIVLGLVSNLVVFYSYFAYITALWGVIEGILATENNNRSICPFSKTKSC